MKQFLKVLVVSSVALFSIGVQASIITSADVEQFTITTPDKWTVANANTLIDGKFDNIHAEINQVNSRFIGFRNDGEQLSSSKPVSILIDLNGSFIITGFSFYNDWGNILQQQVVELNIGFFGSNGQIGDSIFATALSKNTFDIISIFDDKVFGGVEQIKLDITGVNKTNFEIRELVFNVNSPSTFGLLLLLTLALVLRARKY
jgi:hypothetical protein